MLSLGHSERFKYGTLRNPPPATAAKRPPRYSLCHPQIRSASGAYEWLGFSATVRVRNGEWTTFFSFGCLEKVQARSQDFARGVT